MSCLTEREVIAMMAEEYSDELKEKVDMAIHDEEMIDD